MAFFRETTPAVCLQYGNYQSAVVIQIILQKGSKGNCVTLYMGLVCEIKTWQIGCHAVHPNPFSAWTYA